MTTLRHDGWTLREAARPDIEVLMRWFPTYESVNVWGGPAFRFPFTRNTFFDDVFWGKMASYGLFDATGDLQAFGQIYERDERIHLARLVVAPPARGLGIGRRLIEMLMDEGTQIYPWDEVSLFVFRENRPALECYRSLGFTIQPYPDDMPYADVCYYLTRPAPREEN